MFFNKRNKRKIAKMKKEIAENYQDIIWDVEMVIENWKAQEELAREKFEGSDLIARVAKIRENIEVLEVHRDFLKRIAFDLYEVEV